VRDYFRTEKGVIIQDKPRDFEWWVRGQSLYLDYFQETGFKLISPEEAAPGDCVLMSIRSPVPNHGGVMIEDGLLLHHLQWKLSLREPIHRWGQKISHWLRYEGDAK
jgi:cell wall-associated NlpC family hydrolase